MKLKIRHLGKLILFIDVVGKYTYPSIFIKKNNTEIVLKKLLISYLKNQIRLITRSNQHINK